MMSSPPSCLPLVLVTALCAACGGSTESLPSAAQPLDAGLEASLEAASPDVDAAQLPETGADVLHDVAVEADAPMDCVATFTAEIAPVIDGLLYMSESDRPFEVVSFADEDIGPITPSHLLELLQLPAGTVVEQRTLDDFFTSYMLTGPDGARYEQMRQVLEANLTDLTVIRVGEIEIHVYVVGRTGCAQIAGLTTVAIET